MSDDINKDLKKSLGDYMHTGARVGLSSIPIIGGVASELFNLAIAEPLSRRRDEWLKQLYDSLISLEKRLDGFSIEKLKENELFISVVLKSTQIALRNHQIEKILALKNAVINTACNISIDEDEQLMFLNIIDELTAWEIRLLNYFEDPALRFKEKDIKPPTEPSYNSPVICLSLFFNELKGKENYIRECLFRDLDNKYLIVPVENDIFGYRLNEFGRKFLNYIKSE